MATVNQPSITFNIIPARLAASNTPQKVLFVGQMTSGTATPGTLVQNIGVSGEEGALFGNHSLLAGMIRAARRMNQSTQFDALPLADNGAGVAATGSIAFTGVAASANTLTVTIGSLANYTFSIAVPAGQSAAATATAVAAAINANAYVPVSAAVATATVNLTALNKGTLANKIGIRVIDLDSTQTVVVTQMSGGATNPVLTTVFDPIASIRYQTVAWPNSYTKSTVTTFLDGRFNVTNNVLDGVAYCSNTDTYSNLVTLGNGLNSKSLLILGNKQISDGSAIYELDDEIASQWAAIVALRLTLGADISQFVIGSGGSLDTFGGPSLASLPYFNTPLPDLPLIDPTNEWIVSEQAGLNTAGISYLGNNPSRTQIIAGDMFTTYKTNSASIPDPSFVYLNNVHTISQVREYYYVNFRSNYAQTRLTSGDLIPNVNMANATSISSFCDQLFSDLGDQALAQKGENALQFYKRNRTVTLDLSAGSATIAMIVPIVVQLRVVLATIQIGFENFGG